MFCKNCGAQLQDDVAFCPKCGTKVGDGQQAGEQPKNRQKASKPKKPVKKAAKASGKRKALIGAGIGIVGVVLLLVVVLSVSYLMSDFEYYNFGSFLEGESIEYRVSVAYIGAGGEVTFPSEVRLGLKTYSVYFVCIDERANKSKVTSIKIPNGVRYIEDKAFRGCSSLKSIKIPDSVIIIQGEAFRGCSSLKSIKIPDSVTGIGGYAFYDCSSLTSIELSDSVTEIYPCVFENCSSLTSIEIPDSVTAIRGCTFMGCSSLTSIEIPDSVTEIGDIRYSDVGYLHVYTCYAFKDCSSLTRVVISGIPEFIDPTTFDGCTRLDSVIIAGVEVPLKNIENGTWKEVVEKNSVKK